MELYTLKTVHMDLKGDKKRFLILPAKKGRAMNILLKILIEYIFKV